MTERMKSAREAFTEAAGPRVMVTGATLSWPASLTETVSELVFFLSIDRSPPRFYSILINDGDDVVQVAREWGELIAEQLAKIPRPILLTKNVVPAKLAY